MAKKRLPTGSGAGPKRVFRPKICFAALRAAGRSFGCAESETRDFIIVGWTVEYVAELTSNFPPP